MHTTLYMLAVYNMTQPKHWLAHSAFACVHYNAHACRPSVDKVKARTHSLVISPMQSSTSTYQHRTHSTACTWLTKAQTLWISTISKSPMTLLTKKKATFWKCMATNSRPKLPMFWIRAIQPKILSRKATFFGLDRLYASLL